jgi:putative hemolysin
MTVLKRLSNNDFSNISEHGRVVGIHICQTRRNVRIADGKRWNVCVKPEGEHFEDYHAHQSVATINISI